MDYLSHHGILGMKWGIRRYQNKDGSLTPAGKAHYGVGEGTKNAITKAKSEELSAEAKEWLKKGGSKIETDDSQKSNSKARYALDAAALLASGAAAIMSMSITGIASHELLRGKKLSTKYGDIKLDVAVPAVAAAAAGATAAAAVTGIHNVKNVYEYEKYKKKSKGNEYDRDYSIGKDTVFQTLSDNPDRTKDAEYFYAAFTENDKAWYKAMFSKSATPLIDGTIVPMYKTNIGNKAVKDIKVASEKTGTNVMRDLYNNDSDFKQFIDDPQRLYSYLPKKARLKVYKDSKETLKQINKKSGATDEELANVYKLFNYSLPNDGRGNEAVGKDIAVQRKKFFDVLKNNGYGALIDTNDSYYGGYGKRVQSAVIVFDQDSIIPESTKQLTMKEVMSASKQTKKDEWSRKIHNRHLDI